MRKMTEATLGATPIGRVPGSAASWCGSSSCPALPTAEPSTGAVPRGMREAGGLTGRETSAATGSSQSKMSRARVGGLALATALAITGCAIGGNSAGGDRGPTNPPATALPSASATASRATAAPTDPRVTAAQSWLRAVDHAYTTGDTRALRTTSLLGECRGCANVVGEVTTMNRPGYRHSGGHITIHSAHLIDRKPVCGAVVGGCQAAARFPQIAIDVTIAALDVVDPRGRRDPISGPAVPHGQIIVTLARTRAAGWRTLSFQVITHPIA
jgi:hypothetical protein